MASWIGQPRLWAQAMKRAKELAPEFTRAFWREAVRLYVRFGGKFVADVTLESDPDEDLAVGE